MRSDNYWATQTEALQIHINRLFNPVTSMRKSTILLYTIFVALFVIHISFIAYKVFYELPNVHVSKKPLKDIDFPLVFRVCVNEIKNGNKKYQRFGYNNIEDFFRGQSRYNKSLFGWGGHLPNGSNIGTVEGKSLLFHYYNRSK